MDTATTCPDCDFPGDGICNRCHGSRRVLPDRSFGKYQAEIICPRCEGSGLCPTCRGSGEVRYVSQEEESPS